MTLNRFITSLIQLAMAGVVIPLCYAMYRDVKENGFFPDED